MHAFQYENSNENSNVMYDKDDVHPCHIILLSLSPIKDKDAHRKFISRFRLLISDSILKDQIDIGNLLLSSIFPRDSINS